MEPIATNRPENVRGMLRTLPDSLKRDADAALVRLQQRKNEIELHNWKADYAQQERDRATREYTAGAERRRAELAAAVKVGREALQTERNERRRDLLRHIRNEIGHDGLLRWYERELGQMTKAEVSTALHNPSCELETLLLEALAPTIEGEHRGAVLMQIDGSRAGRNADLGDIEAGLTAWEKADPAPFVDPPGYEASIKARILQDKSGGEPVDVRGLDLREYEARQAAAARPVGKVRERVAE